MDSKSDRPLNIHQRIVPKPPPRNVPIVRFLQTLPHVVSRISECLIEAAPLPNARDVIAWTVAWESAPPQSAISHSHLQNHLTAWNCILQTSEVIADVASLIKEASRAPPNKRTSQ